MFENADLCGTNWRERYFDALSSYRTKYTFIWRTGEHSNSAFQPQIIDDFPAVWNYGKLSAKFLVSSVKIIDMVGFLLFFKVLLEQLIKFLLITQISSCPFILPWN